MGQNPSQSTSANRQPVLITGLGLLSSLGEGPQDHWVGLNEGKPKNLESEKFAPYSAHALGEVEWANQISRRDMRQMEPWQQIGTYAAGLALDDAGVKDNEELCYAMDMIVAAGGGERDVEVDGAILADARGKNETDALLAERLSNDLRPTLFLAQLSNLLAGNISIVHKVTGSSRTFMGEEGAGISAIQTAWSRIASGQSDMVLVGGAYNGERSDMMLVSELGQYLHQGDFKPVSERLNGEGFINGSIGAFLVLESAAHAKARGANAYAEIKNVVSDHNKRAPGVVSSSLGHLLDDLNDDAPVVLSGATGVAPDTSEELDLLAARFPDTKPCTYGSVTGHGLEAQFPLGIAFAALAAKNKSFYGNATPASSIVVTSVGHWRSEGAGLVVPVASEEKE